MAFLGQRSDNLDHLPSKSNFILASSSVRSVLYLIILMLYITLILLPIRQKLSPYNGVKMVF
jgi:hypothetical protein